MRSHTHSGPHKDNDGDVLPGRVINRYGDYPLSTPTLRALANIRRRLFTPVLLSSGSGSVSGPRPRKLLLPYVR